jgi:Cdc6-like AAA superfamily ATPase
VKEAKNTEWRTEIMEEVVEAVRTGTVPSVQIPTDDHLKLYGKKLPKPDKSVIIATTKARSRFRDLSKQ